MDFTCAHRQCFHYSQMVIGFEIPIYFSLMSSIFSTEIGVEIGEQSNLFARLLSLLDRGGMGVGNIPKKIRKTYF